MRCKNCGAELIIKDGLYICESCGNKFELFSGYENCDVFIAYVENDENERRTKDSIIAQEIYNALEKIRINTYYQRISSQDMSADECESASMLVLHSSKVVIVVGTDSLYFSRLLEKYNGFEGKMLIPIYSNINAYEIPKSLNGLQALNYDSVGAMFDLSKNILNILGRGNEVDIVNEADKRLKKHRKIFILSATGILLVVVSIVLYIVFGTTYVLPSKKYEKAQQLMHEERYSEAIELLNKIADYKNSSTLISDVYNQYIGYYQNENGTIGLHLMIEENKKANVEISRNIENSGVVKIIENAEISNNTILLGFNDSANNQGTAKLTLTNDGISLSVDMDNGESFNTFFNIKDKSDKPIIKEITADTIKMWLSKKTTEDDIKALGYELVFEKPLYKDDNSGEYTIKNTDIKVACTNDSEGVFVRDEFFNNNDADKSRIAFYFSAPAKLLIPDKIGQKPFAYVENDILYVPNAHFGETIVINDDDAETISDDTPVCCTSKMVLYQGWWRQMVSDCVYVPRIEQNFDETIGGGYDSSIFTITAEAENDNEFLYSIFLREENYVIMCKINKSTYAIEYLGEFYNDDGSDYVNWQSFSELTQEFPTDFD